MPQKMNPPTCACCGAEADNVRYVIREENAVACSWFQGIPERVVMETVDAAILCSAPCVIAYLGGTVAEDAVEATTKQREEE